MRAVYAIFAAAVLAACARGTHAEPAPWLSPCRIDGVAARTYCGTYDVWEDRDAKQGRRIGLRISSIRPPAFARP